MTSIGIIGAGQIGSALARAFARSGIAATIGSRRGPESLKAVLAGIGPEITAGTVEQAAAKDMVFVAVNWSQLQGLFASLPDFAGRMVVDTNNPIEAPLFKPFDLGGVASSELVASMARGARVVKAFNHLRSQLLSTDPRSEGGQRVLFYAGDDTAAKAQVGELIERLGFAGIDLGTLATGARLTQFPGGPLSVVNLVKFD